ncbi:WD repeat-containing protein [Klebsormidium nitens]|uniref:Katanin p80 WD40 repeat-containing subunit B1 homolog n=1 Tax=Klebsormidium nitens TaxID=105231 RepID=A0A0U9HJ02_KLENI|nr:WD repeat-containing protein [Klebsormidium nitens]|eukprot:GAQ80741.1 WD repeat-containing protein [Klebsormidium nitens]
MAKRAYKLQEFVAHSSNVNCLKIGRRSSGVLVTGGDDKKVNMWAIGKPDSIMSLTGHSSPIECVTFDLAEEIVVAGAAGGTLKIWDLELQKVVRTLTGHRANCISVDFHPYGEYFASGSLDTNLKIWDIRRRGCVHTYKGHTGGVRCVKFSPDGRWLVSGGQDNSVKLWDLTAGKMMHDFTLHDGPIHDLTFHPHEFVLATGSQDRTTKLWDLETYELIGSAGPETTGVRNVFFTPDGRTVLSAVQDNLKVWGWEPVVCHDTVDTNWGRISDMALHEGKVIGCSIQQSTVGVWIVDLSRVAPFSAGAQSKAAPKPISRPATEIRPVSNGSDNGSQVASRESSQQSSRATTPAKPISRARTPPDSAEQVFSSPSVHAGSASSPPPAKAADFYAPRASPAAASGARQAGSVIATPPRGSPRPGADVSTAPLPSDRSEKRELQRTPPRRREEATPRGEKGNGGSSSLPRGEDRDPMGEAAASGSGRTEEGTEGGVNVKHNNGSVTDRSAPKDYERPSQPNSSADDTGQKAGIGRRVSRAEKKEIEFEILAPAGPNPHRTSEADAAGVPTSAEPVRAGGKRRSGLFKPEDHDIFGPTRTADGAGLSGRDSDAVVRSENGREAEGAVPSGRGKSPRGEKETKSVAIAAPGDSLMRGAALPGAALSTPGPSGREPPFSHHTPASNGGSRARVDALSALSALARSPSVTGDRSRKEGPLGLDIKAFLPKSASKLAPDGDAASVSDAELIESLMGQHATMSTIMQSRLTNLAVVRTFWARNDLKGAIEAMDKMADHALLVDVLGTMAHRSDVFSLELAAQAMPLLGELLTSQHDRYVLVAIAVAASLLKSFGSLIKEARQASPAVGVDLSAEERLERCNACYRGFLVLRGKLEGLARTSGEVGKMSRELIFELEELQ